MDLNQWKDLIQNNDAVAVYFSGKDCNVCHVLKPKVQELFHSNFPLIDFNDVNLQDSPEIRGLLSIFTIPTLVIFFEGKELFRWSRSFSLAEVEQRVQRNYNLFFSKP